jgi:two-component sensor histidine kinase
MVAPASVGSAVVAGIAVSFALFHVAAALSIPAYRWGLWAGGLSAATAVFAGAVFLQYNAQSPAAQVLAERLQYSAIVWLPTLLAGFERGVAGERPGRWIGTGVGVAAVLSVIIWGSSAVVREEIISRQLFLFDVVYREPAVGPLGQLVAACAAAFAIVIVARLVRRKARGSPGRRMLQIGAIIWLATAVNDVAGTVGVPVPHYTLEYGFLAFLFAVMGQILTQQYRAYQLLRRQRERIADSRRHLEVMVSERTSQLVELAENLKKEVADHTRTEQELRRTSHEREVLIREIHHRSKNNLQILSSLWSLARTRVENPELDAIIEENQNRAHAMAAVHEQLYQSQSLSRIDFAAYLAQLSDHLASIHCPPEADIHIELMTEPIQLPIDLAVPLGLFANEVLTNSFKHAFAGRRTGVVRIGLGYRGEGAVLLLSDDGTGMETSLVEGNGGSMGSELIRALADQVHGCLTVESESGTTYRLELPEL